MNQPYKTESYFQELDAILDAAASALIIFDSSGMMLYCNNTVKNLFGYSPDNLRGRHLNKLLATGVRDKHNNYFEKFFEHSSDRSMGGGESFPALHKSGVIVYVSIALTRLEYKGQNCVLATITKAHKLNSATELLRRSKANLAKRIDENKKLLNVAENSRDAVFPLDDKGRITWINKAAYIMVGKHNNNIIDLAVTKLFSSSKNKLAHSQFKKSLMDSLSYSGELDYISENESRVELDVVLQPVFESEQLFGFIFTARDVSNRKRLEIQMRGNNELLETTARMAKLGFYTLDIVSNKLQWSEEVYKLHDLPNNVNIDVESALQYYAPEARPAISAAVQRCIETGEAFDLELPFITAKQRNIWVRAVGYAEFKSGKPTKLKGAFQDITYMRAAAKAAEDAARTKSNFLANMSHELRTPISGVLGVSELLCKTELDTQQNKYVNVINQSANTLLFLVNQILDFAKLDSGSQQLENSYFNLKKFVYEKTYIHSLAAKENGVAFNIEFSEQVPEKIFSDNYRLAQIINNLCSNAVKFTKQGSITVSVEIASDNALKLAVKDTGIGIKESDLDKLFVEFQQVDNSFSREYQGTGLGLSITRQLVTLMQGEVELSSSYGNGSVFWVKIPIIAYEEGQAESQVNAKLPNTLVLVNDLTAANTWFDVAQKQASKIRAFADIAEFLSLLKSDHQWPLIVLLDLPSELPRQTTVDSVKRLLTNKQKMVVNKRYIEDIEQDLNLTFLELDSGEPEKPVFDLCLSQFNQIEHWMMQSEELKQDFSGKKILIAEDNPVNQMLFENMLIDEHVDITMVDNGQEALEKLESNEGFDLVIMDCQMPVLDGFETTKKIREHKNQKIAGIRIVAATAHGFSEDIQKCYVIGMNDVIVKPFSSKQLIEMIARNL